MSSYYASTSILFLLNLVKLNFKIKCAVTIIPFTVSMNIKTFILETEKLFCIKKFACSENKVELDKNKCFLDNFHQPPSNWAFIGPKLKYCFLIWTFQFPIITIWYIWNKVMVISRSLQPECGEPTAALNLMKIFNRFSTFVFWQPKYAKHRIRV